MDKPTLLPLTSPTKPTLMEPQVLWARLVPKETPPFKLSYSESSRINKPTKTLFIRMPLLGSGMLEKSTQIS